MIEEEVAEFDPGPRLGRGYRQGPSLADRKLEKLGEEGDSWSKKDLFKIKWLRRWRHVKALFKGPARALGRKSKPSSD